MNKFQIQFKLGPGPNDEKNICNFSLVYLGSRNRFPSVTDIKFIKKDLIIVAHRCASKLYLIQLENNSYKVLDSIVCKIDSKPSGTEAFIFFENKIYLICFSEYLLIYDLINLKFIFNKVIKINDCGTRYHGIEFFIDKIYITPSNKSIKSVIDNIVEFCPKKYTIKYLSLGDLSNAFRIKDIIFVDKDLVILPILFKTSTTMHQKGHLSNGFIGLYSFPDLKLLDKIEYKDIHFDLGTFKDGIFYICGAELKGDYIFFGELDLGSSKSQASIKFKYIKKYKVESFPHGIDIFENLLAYTCYGTDSLYIIDKNEIK